MRKRYRGKRGVVLVPESWEDLWVLDKILSPGSVMEITDTRAVKGESGEERKKVRLRLRVKRTELRENSLRVLGVIEEGEPEEYIKKGAHHSVEVRPGREVFLPEGIPEGLRDLVREEKTEPVVVAVMDLFGADVYLVKGRRIDPLARVDSGYRGKRGEWDEKKYFGDLHALLERYGYEKVVGGPGKLAEAFASRYGYPYFRTSMAGYSGLKEVIRGYKDKIVREKEIAKQEEAFSRFMEHLGKGDGMAVYGEGVFDYLKYGMVDTLLIHEDYYRENRERLSEVLKNLRGVKVHIFSRGYEAGDSMAHFKIAAILRYST